MTVAPSWYFIEAVVDSIELVVILEKLLSMGASPNKGLTMFFPDSNSDNCHIAQGTDDLIDSSWD